MANLAKSIYFAVICVVCALLSLKSMLFIAVDTMDYFYTSEIKSALPDDYKAEASDQKVSVKNKPEPQLTPEQLKKNKLHEMKQKDLADIMREIPQLIIALVVFLAHMIMWCRCSRKECGR